MSSDNVPTEVHMYPYIFIENASPVLTNTTPPNALLDQLYSLSCFN